MNFKIFSWLTFLKSAFLSLQIRMGIIVVCQEIAIVFPFLGYVSNIHITLILLENVVIPISIFPDRILIKSKVQKGGKKYKVI